MKRTTIFAMLLGLAFTHPLNAQQNLLLSACPADFRDGPYYENGHPYHGIPARGFVERFLLSSEAADPWVNVDAASLRLLADGTDYTACQRLTLFLTNGARNAPPPEPWVFFTAGGFYFVSAWTPAQPLSNYSTGYGSVLVFDSAFNLLGAFAA